MNMSVSQKVKGAYNHNTGKNDYHEVTVIWDGSKWTLIVGDTALELKGAALTSVIKSVEFIRERIK